MVVNRAILPQVGGAGAATVMAMPAHDVSASSSPELLRVRQVAQRFQVSIGTVRRWTDRGLLPAERTAGGHRRYRAADVEDLFRSLTADADPVARQSLAAQLSARTGESSA